MSTRDASVSDLVNLLYDTLRYFDASEPILNTAYAPGKWNVRFVLVHLADTETVLLDRLKRLAAEKNPTLMAFDQDQWASNLFYEKRDLNVARQQFEAARRSVIELLRTLSPEVDARTGTHSEAGTRSFGQILSMIISHNRHHLEQIKAAAEGRTWTKR